MRRQARFDRPRIGGNRALHSTFPLMELVPMTARWIASAPKRPLYLKCRENSREYAKLSAPRPASSTVRRAGAKALKPSGATPGLHRQPRLRCRQADQGARSGIVLVEVRKAMLICDRNRSPPPTFRIATAVSRCRRPCFGLFPLSRARPSPIVHRRQRLSGPGRFTAPWPAIHYCPISSETGQIVKPKRPIG